MDPCALVTKRRMMFFPLTFLIGVYLLAFSGAQNCAIVNKIGIFNWCNLTKIPHVQNDTVKLMLLFNYITEIDASSFPLLKNLLFLHLGSQRNNSLTIRKNSFQNLPNLIELDLADNKILILDPEAFLGLSKLQNLILFNNNLNESILENDYFKDLMSLQFLDLSSNKIAYLKPNPLFYHLFYFYLINLKHNQISRICEGDLYSFQMKYFAVMDLSANHLYKSNISVWEQCGNPFRDIQFDTLILSSNGFSADNTQKLCNALNGTKLIQLKLSSHIMGPGFGFKNTKDPDNSTFVGLANSDLKILDLSEGSIFHLKPYTFGNLSKLEMLILNNNKINSIEEFAFHGLHSLQILNLSQNLLGELYSHTFDGLPNVTIIDLQQNNIGAITTNAFAKLTQLKYLDLRDNSIKSIQFFANMKFVEYIFLGGNKLKMIDSFKVDTNFADFSSNRLKNLGDLHKLLTNEFLNYVILKQNVFLECFVFYNISNKNSLIHLDLSENVIELIWKNGQCLDVFHKLSKLLTLKLNNNYLTFFPDGIFNGLTSLKTLNLSSNLLTYIFPGVFPTNLDTVDLSKNKLLSPSPEIFASLQALDITYNQYICDCSITDLIIWLKQTNTTLLGEKDDIYCVFPQNFRFVPLHNLTTDGCDEDIILMPLRFSLFVFTSFSIIMFLIAVTVYTQFRGLCFYLFKRLIDSVLQDPPSENSDLYKYDAYFCYSSKDFQWVQDAFFKNLDSQYCDKNRFQLCFEERDFIPGEDHIMNIRNAISNSKKTICIVTKRFLKDGWCVEAFNYAQSRYFSELKDVLIMIVVGSLSEYQLKRYQPIRTFVQRSQYLKWPEDYQDIDWFLDSSLLLELRTPVTTAS
ncbi:toll-like receptor 5 isoform X2 [Bombina bombina]|uniref:toll-like receptor 5 isoform X2 n=1 Tax=Bombina bombina TaxID=8345 RepID=UPI00235B303C|nr:toll-like receptor 5 isoform X2 [Bombina bombina]